MYAFAAIIFMINVGAPMHQFLGGTTLSHFFLSYYNDLPKYVQSCNLYADDTMIEKSGKTLDEIIPYIQSDIDNLLGWFYSNKLIVSNDNSCCMLIGSSQRLKEFENCQHIAH